MSKTCENCAVTEARLKLCNDGTPDARGKFRVIEAEPVRMKLSEFGV